MPELPEVETIRSKLEPVLRGQILVSVTVRRRDLRQPVPSDLAERLSGKCVLAIRRRSKYLLLDFDSGETLILHLGMSGRIYFTPADAPLHKHDHLLFNFSGGQHLRFRDPRRFGLALLCPTAQLETHPLLSGLGPEPLSDNFDAAILSRLLKSSRAPVKTVLMDASKVVGVGNIYANEALFMAGICPSRRAHRVTQEEAKRLCTAIKNVLKSSIEAGGTTFRDYVTPDESPGLHRLALAVYNREGQPCLQCGNKILRATWGQRGTFYCRNCQI